MMQLYINSSDKSLQIGDIIDYSYKFTGPVQTYKVIQIYDKPVSSVIGRITLMCSSNPSDNYHLKRTFDLCEIYLKYFRYNNIDNRTPFGKFINDIYIKEKEK